MPFRPTLLAKKPPARNVISPAVTAVKCSAARGGTLVVGYTDIQDFFTDIHQIYKKHRYTPDIQPDIQIMHYF